MVRNLALVLLLLLGLTQSCSESAGPERNLLGVTVSYTIGSYGPISNRMTITVDGVAQAERNDWSEGTSIKGRWLQLSKSEINELKQLLEPFTDFERSYEDPTAPTDGPSVYVALNRSGVKHEVSVYPANYDAIPPQLAQLRDWLGALFARALRE